MTTETQRELADANGTVWVRVTDPQTKDTPKGLVTAFVARQRPAGFDGVNFPGWCDQYRLVMSRSDSDRTVFGPVKSVEEGLAKIAAQFAAV